jgi:ribosomal-protein-alanine N-acetyltransferase
MRLELLPLSAADEESFLTAARLSRALHTPWVSPPRTTEAFRDFLEATGPSRRRLLLWVRASRSKELAGYFSLGEIVRGSLNSAYLGYWAAAPWQGRGAMAEGMKLLLRHAFRGVRLHRVEANIQPGNRSSIALARRSGFRREGFSPRYLKVGGRWCDHERWAITSEDWRSGSSPRSSRS